MTKAEFTNELSKRTKMHPDVLKYVLDNVAQIIIENICNGENVELPKIGRFSLKTRKSSYGYDIKSRERKMKNEYKYPTCKLSPSFKSRIQNFLSNLA